MPQKINPQLILRKKSDFDQLVSSQNNLLFSENNNSSN